MSFPFACHSSPISRAPMASGARSCSAVRNSMSRLRAPSAACADARANARRRSRSESVETGFCDRTRSTRAAGSQCGQPTSPRFTRTCRRYAPTRAGEREIIARPRTPKKHSAPEGWSPRRVAPAAEPCSNAVLECRVYRRFAVTSQLQNVADSIPAMCSASGSSDDPGGRAQRSFAGTVQNELDQQETMTRGLAVVIFFVIRSAFVSGFLALGKL